MSTCIEFIASNKSSGNPVTRSMMTPENSYLVQKWKAHATHTFHFSLALVSPVNNRLRYRASEQNKMYFKIIV